MRIGHGDGHLLNGTCINLFFDHVGTHLPMKALEVKQFKRGILRRTFRQRPADGDGRACRHPGVSIVALHQIQIPGLVLDVFLTRPVQDLLRLVNQQTRIGVRTAIRFENVVKQQGDFCILPRLHVGAIDGIHRVGADNRARLALADLLQRVVHSVQRYGVILHNDNAVLLLVRGVGSAAHRQRSGIGGYIICPTIIDRFDLAFLNSAAVDLHLKLLINVFVKREFIAVHRRTVAGGKGHSHLGERRRPHRLDTIDIVVARSVFLKAPLHGNGLSVLLVLKR